jgi:hypothetical protein
MRNPVMMLETFKSFLKRVRTSSFKDSPPKYELLVQDAERPKKMHTKRKHHPRSKRKRTPCERFQIPLKKHEGIDITITSCEECINTELDIVDSGETLSSSSSESKDSTSSNAADENLDQHYFTKPKADKKSSRNHQHKQRTVKRKSTESSSDEDSVSSDERQEIFSRYAGEKSLDVTRSQDQQKIRKAPPVSTNHTDRSIQDKLERIHEKEAEYDKMKKYDELIAQWKYTNPSLHIKTSLNPIDREVDRYQESLGPPPPPRRKHKGK